jgi:uncharacterized protein YidB (DUF937 family)
MGLLDEVLGQLAGGALGRPQPPQPRTTEAGAGMGMSRILMALLPVVLMMLRNRAGNAPSARVDQSDVGEVGGPGGGGLGDILGQVLGGAGSGGGLGGFGAILEGLQRAGFGEQARSWVSSGQNLPLPPGALEQVFGQGGLAEIARRAGLSQDDAARGLSALMPEVVDHVTPGGNVPNGDDLLASVDALARRLGV